MTKKNEIYIMYNMVESILELTICVRTKELLNTFETFLFGGFILSSTLVYLPAYNCSPCVALQ